jgi:5-methylcytosine-specific restriction endonuclease McrA
VSRPLRPSPTGYRGCLSLIGALALFAWPLLVLLSVIGWSDLQAGGLAVVVGALLSIRASGRGRAGRRQVTGSHFRGLGVGSGQPQAASRVGEARDGRASVVRNIGQIQPARAHARLTNGPVGSRREPDRANRSLPKDRADRPSAALVRRARDPLPARLRFGILQRDGFRCRYCGRPGTASGVVLHVDHLIPFAAGGATSEANLVTACEECNLGKATRAVVRVRP